MLLGFNALELFALLNPCLYIFVHVWPQEFWFHHVICRFDSCVIEGINSFKSLLPEFAGKKNSRVA